MLIGTSSTRANVFAMSVLPTPDGPSSIILDFSMVKGDWSSKEECDGGGDGGTQACIVA